MSSGALNSSIPYHTTHTHSDLCVMVVAGRKKTHKGGHRHFTSEDDLARQQEKARKEREWRVCDHLIHIAHLDYSVLYYYIVIYRLYCTVLYSYRLDLLLMT